MNQFLELCRASTPVSRTQLVKLALIIIALPDTIDASEFGHQFNLLRATDADVRTAALDWLADKIAKIR
jgi:hypothetical protein